MIRDQMTGGDHEQHALVKRVFRRHLLAYGVIMGALTAANIVIGGGWWTFWPMCVWGLVFSLHFFYSNILYCWKR